MLTFTNHRHHGTTPFAEYAKSPGYSHSFLKYQQHGVVLFIEPTDKMRLGSLVDAILCNTGADITDPQYQIAKFIAAYIDRHFPWLRQCKAQQHYTATVSCNGLEMPIKTLIDFVLPGIATVEMKVSDCTKKQAETMVQFMGYDNQCFIERSCANVPDAYLLVYCRKTKDIYFTKRECSGADMWLADKIMMFGRAVV